MTVEEYRSKFPDAPLCSEEFSRKRSETIRERWKNEEYRKKVVAKLNSEEVKKKRSEANKRSWKNRETRKNRIAGIKNGLSKCVEERVCVECGKTFVAKKFVKNQIRCSPCLREHNLFSARQRSRNRYRLWRQTIEWGMKETVEQFGYLTPSYIGLRGELGTVGTPQMDTRILSDGRIAGAVWLENKGHYPANIKIQGKIELPHVKTPWRRRLVKAGWQGRIMKRCARCGNYGIEVWEENPHCFECDGELVLAIENEYYCVNEIVCNSCGVVDNAKHFIFTCGKCGSEIRVKEDVSGNFEFKQV
jgi:hypothetical protein